MTFWYISGILLLAAYAALIAYYRKGWNQLPHTAAPTAFMPQTSVSVIVPARNEAANIPILLQHLLAQDYPPHLLEIVIVDDHSTDDTYALATAVNDTRLKVIRMQDYPAQGKAYKKQAITQGILQSKGDLIVTTDADCTMTAGWIKNIVYAYQSQGLQCIAGPVSYTNIRNTAGVFQALDFITMQGITGASLQTDFNYMCNGANFAYSRQAFEKVNGFAGIDDIATGDDMLLLYKIAQQFPGQIAYLRSADAIVQTEPMPDWRSFLNQRIRWASKAGRFQDKRITAVLLLVYLFNVCMVAMAVAALFQPLLWFYWLGLILVKTAVELLLLAPVARFFGQTALLKWFLPLQPLHMAYIVLAGFLGNFKQYEWKGRKVQDGKIANQQ